MQNSFFPAFDSICRSRLFPILGGLAVFCVISFVPAARAQENYEIQVYAYDTVEPGHTMVELHSNFTFEGSKTFQDGMYPTNHQLHETIEITHGFTDWFETGFYIFTSEHNGQGIDWVGDHIRPRWSHSTEMEMARRIESFERDRLPAAAIFR